MFLIFEQPEKAELPILVTEFGIVTDVRSEQSLNAKLPTLDTVLGMISDDCSTPFIRIECFVPDNPFEWNTEEMSFLWT